MAGSSSSLSGISSIVSVLRKSNHSRHFAFASSAGIFPWRAWRQMAAATSMRLRPGARILVFCRNRWSASCEPSSSTKHLANTLASSTIIRANPALRGCLRHCLVKCRTWLPSGAARPPGGLQCGRENRLLHREGTRAFRLRDYGDGAGHGYETPRRPNLLNCAHEYQPYPFTKLLPLSNLYQNKELLSTHLIDARLKKGTLSNLPHNE